MKLVIIESPNKKDSLKKYLGDGYEIMATKGHIRDLPAKSISVDIKNNFEPTYAILPEKNAIVRDLKKVAKEADEILIAADPDREGEAIAWHVAHILGIKDEEKCRITFNEISKSAVQKALKEPRPIDLSLVDAQQARRILDRLVGYKVSPVLCKKIKSNLSAGRVQSVVLKLVVDREMEIKNFKPEEYWNVSVELNKKDGDKQIFKALANQLNNKKHKFTSKEEVEEIFNRIENEEFKIQKIKRTHTFVHAPAPFTTSTMQQEAQNKANMSTAVTTSTAQSLYEGVNIPGEGKTALVTYIRSDSTRISDDARKMANEFINSEFGKNYLPEKPNIYSKKDIQDAHEAIRPISLAHRPEDLKACLKPEAYKLYKLIYERFIASQMAPAEYDNVTIDIVARNVTFRVTGRTMTFAGWTKAYKLSESVNEDEEIQDKLPPMEEGEILNFISIKKEQKFTKPPQRYTESTLIKAMDENGIGRPATYAPTIALLASRDYTAKEKKYLYPTETGITVNEFLQKYFNSVFNIDFTADMESKLDEIEDSEVDWKRVIAKFWHFLEPLIVTANGGESLKEPPQMTDIKCEKCGAFMCIRDGKFGKFYACSNFPTCKNAKPINNTVYKGVCPNCGKRMTERKSKAGKIYFSCEDYTNCGFMSWDEPLGTKCTKCDGYIVKKLFRGKEQIKCSNPKCDYVHEN